MGILSSQARILLGSTSIRESRHQRRASKLTMVRRILGVKQRQGRLQPRKARLTQQQHECVVQILVRDLTRERGGTAGKPGYKHCSFLVLPIYYPSHLHPLIKVHLSVLACSLQLPATLQESLRLFSVWAARWRLVSASSDSR